jgi:hypothetical protein
MMYVLMVAGLLIILIAIGPAIMHDSAGVGLWMILPLSLLAVAIAAHYVAKYSNSTRYDGFMNKGGPWVPSTGYPCKLAMGCCDICCCKSGDCLRTNAPIINIMTCIACQPCASLGTCWISGDDHDTEHHNQTPAFGETTNSGEEVIYESALYEVGENNGETDERDSMSTSSRSSRSSNHMQDVPLGHQRA